MTLAVESDQDLPDFLNTTDKQATKARQLATLCTGIATTRASTPQFQGCFSRTVIVELENKERVVIQFRREALDLECFHVARRALGSVVPEIELLEDDEIRANGLFAYRMTCMPGKMRHQVLRERNLVTSCQSLGRVLAKGLVEGDTANVVDDLLRPHLELLLQSDNKHVRQVRNTTRRLLDELDSLKKLPLWVSHADLNDVNIMVDDQCEVTGLIDWETSTPLPFGMGFCRIHTLAGEYTQEEFYMPPNFELAEKAFWDAVWDGLSDSTRKLVEANIDAVQTAVTLGTLLDAFEQEDGKLGEYNRVVIKALGKHLTYRIPQVRGEKPPYSD